jgi:hypothetical protein
MRFHKRHMGILEIDNWGGRLRRHRLDRDTLVVETWRPTADHLEEWRVMNVTLGWHIQALWGLNVNALKGTSKRAA